MDTISTHKNNIFLAVTIVVVVFTLCFGVYEYRREHDFRCDILHAKLQLNNYTRSNKDIRLTIIDTLGNVLYDSRQKNTALMGNHLMRKEVQDALRYGSGYDIKRTSATNGEKYFYSATYFPSRHVIVRSSVPYSAPLTQSLEQDYTFFYYTAAILLLIAVVLYLRHRLNRSQDEKQRIKRQLTENAAHELKTPAATIEGYLETLTSNPDMPDHLRRKYIGRCYVQSRRMSRLLSDMSTLTRLDYANISRPATDIDAAGILRQIVSETEPSFAEKNIAVSLSVPEALPMKGDQQMVYSLFRNIFDNTLAYASGATQFDVVCESFRGDKMTFTLSDNGVGVDTQHLTHLFERFYRTDKGRSRRLGGTGLGLAIVKNIAVQYGGSATAYTTPGGGLTIKVEICAR
ncbi:MAG: HAMP domain-containing sensor histidine kinase [Prevotella sp.]|nr:HAMP domain-containing sensor histidine kinase [Prevotella sp.]